MPIPFLRPPFPALASLPRTPCPPPPNCAPSLGKLHFLPASLTLEQSSCFLRSALSMSGRGRGRPPGLIWTPGARKGEESFSGGTLIFEDLSVYAVQGHVLFLGQVQSPR